jgi:hypothetical protein
MWERRPGRPEGRRKQGAAEIYRGRSKGPTEIAGCREEKEIEG